MTFRVLLRKLKNRNNTKLNLSIHASHIKCKAIYIALIKWRPDFIPNNNNYCHFIWKSFTISYFQKDSFYALLIWSIDSISTDLWCITHAWQTRLHANPNKILKVDRISFSITAVLMLFELRGSFFQNGFLTLDFHIKSA